jgi:two-component system, OmpR family, sensor kinase
VRSIRSRLLVWLTGGLVVGTAAAAAATYALTRSQVGSLFDEELKQVALAVQLGAEPGHSPRVRIARPGFHLSVRAYDESGRVYFETAFPSLPSDLAPTFSEGFFSGETTEGAWRVYTHVTEDGIVQAGQPVASRDALARDLAQRMVMPMLLFVPLLTVLVAWSLKGGLAMLDETSRRVSDRDASRLDPLPLDNVPPELVPLIGQINALLHRLAASLDAERRFLADAAHELRSPVAALALQVQLAERAQSPDGRAKAIEELRKGIERARRLVQQLLDYARLEPGVATDAFTRVNLAALARQGVGAYSARAEALGIDLGADAPGEVVVAGVESQLRSLLENLLDNALRYAPPRSAVTVHVRSRGGRVTLAVMDAGPGIPAEERMRVFERFHRVAGDETRGTGLGLAIGKAIVERHHGSIELADASAGAEPPGLLVRVQLPAA